MMPQTWIALPVFEGYSRYEIFSGTNPVCILIQVFKYFKNMYFFKMESSYGLMSVCEIENPLSTSVWINLPACLHIQHTDGMLLKTNFILG
jgi:hypothetical protein